MNENTPAWALYGVLNNPTTPANKRELATKYLNLKIEDCTPKLQRKIKELLNEEGS